VWVAGLLVTLMDFVLVERKALDSEMEMASLKG